MYNSVKPWLNVPYKILPFIKRTGSGTKIFGDAVDELCYPEARVELITNKSGSEVVSTTRLYVDGGSSIKVTDNVIFESETRPIQRINTFYRDGKPDIRVVYL